MEKSENRSAIGIGIAVTGSSRNLSTNPPIKISGENRPKVADAEVFRRCVFRSIFHLLKNKDQRMVKAKIRNLESTSVQYSIGDSVLT